MMPGARVDQAETVPQAIGMATISEAQVIAQVTERLIAAHADLPPDHFAAAVDPAWDARFNQSSVREFVPLLVERRARSELANTAPVPVWSS